MLSRDAPIKILLVEDDERLAKLTVRYLEGDGCLVHWVTTGPHAITAIAQRQFDVVLLDLMLPGRDGMDVCREIRTRLDVPIIMVTARKDEVDRVLGLDAGADDYVTKPFSSRELVSRIRALVRRARGLVGPQLKVLRVGDITVDPARMRVVVSGRDIELADDLAIEVFGASSVKASLDIDWRKPDARTEALNRLITQFENLRIWLRKNVPRKEIERPPISEHIATIEKIIAQDTEPDPMPGANRKKRLREGTSSDRLTSLGDRDMRHGRKSKSKTFTGYKRHVA